ncbi:MAG TPA: cyclase family protein [Herpetosiphonaceae bacterium]
MCLPKTLASVRSNVSRRDLFKATAAAALTAAAPSAIQAAPAQALRYRSVIDLTHVLGTQTPLFPGYDQVEIRVNRSYQQDGYYANQLNFNEHSGTHMDSPRHFDPDGLSVDQIPPSRLIGPLAVIDVQGRAARDPDTQVTPDDLLAWERRYGRIPSGAVVIMNSGWATRIGNAAAFLNADSGGTLHFPGWSKAATDLLINERNVIGIGVDTLSLDFGASTDFAVHYSWLPSGRWGLENVANLADVPPRGATLVVGAPKHYGGSGGPARLMALV